jgi:hypothetical protein
MSQHIVVHKTYEYDVIPSEGAPLFQDSPVVFVDAHHDSSKHHEHHHGHHSHHKHHEHHHDHHNQHHENYNHHNNHTEHHERFINPLERFYTRHNTMHSILLLVSF